VPRRLYPGEGGGLIGGSHMSRMHKTRIAFHWLFLVLPSLGCGGGGNATKIDTAVAPVDTRLTADTPSTKACSMASAVGMRACVSAARYREDLEFVAQPRSPGSAHWQAVQDRCAGRFAELGYTVERQAYGTGVNVLGTRVGDSANPTVLVSAHYDHIGDCPGADDDGTGVAAVLELARVFSTASYAGTLVLACWDEEERGLLGSKAYVAELKTRGTKLTAMMGFEMLGYRSSAPYSQTMPKDFESFFPEAASKVKANELRADFIGLVYDQMAASFGVRVATHASAELLPLMEIMVPAALKSSALAADLRRSDHASFWDGDVPAIMISDTADLRNPHYHCQGGPDVVADLDLDFAVKVVRAAAGTLAETLVVR